MPLFLPNPTTPSDLDLLPLMINVKDAPYNAKVDGVTDDSVAFTSAYQAASTKKLPLYIPGGTLIKGSDTLLSNVQIFGSGKGVTTIKLKNGANTDLFSGLTSSINLAGANGTGPSSGINFWGFYNLTLDGNRSNQTAGPSYPIRCYGYGHILEHIEIVNGYSGNILLDWYSSANPTAPNNAFMPLWYDVMSHDCNGLAYQIGGPTDMQWIAVNGFASGSHVAHIAPNCIALRMTHCHLWATPTGNSSVTLLNEAAELVLSSCQIEGSDACALVLLGNDCQASDLEVGSTGDATRQGRGIQLGQPAGNTPYAGQIYQSGGVTSAAAANICHLSGKAYECRVGVLDEQNTTGNVYALNAYQGGGTGIVGGYPASGNMGYLKMSGVTPDGSPGKGGFFQINNASYYGMQVYDHTGAVLFSLDTFDSVFQLKNGFSFSGYSDNGSTLKYNLNAADGSLLLGNSSSMRSGSGAPAGGLGNIGDYYFRTDTPSTSLQRIYVKTASAVWTGIV